MTRRPIVRWKSWPPRPEDFKGVEPPPPPPGHNLPPPVEPATPARRGNPERAVQRSLLAWLALQFPGCIAAAAENERAPRSKDPLQQARFQQQRRAAGIVPGWPDLTVVLPNGRVFFVEVKSKRGALNDNQRKLHPRLRALGVVVLVARDVDELRRGMIAAGLMPAR